MQLTAGINHVAVLTDDLDRFVDFYREVFDVDVVFSEDAPSFRHAILRSTSCVPGSSPVARPTEPWRTSARSTVSGSAIPTGCTPS